mmetsp:Transcript_27465/g.54932  ORF Transcript_27465/g.54932 Transcript_27465/m.54932 type:complete len:83 (+) Transcript_27465:557-805(+)
MILPCEKLKNQHISNSDSGKEIYFQGLPVRRLRCASNSVGDSTSEKYLDYGKFFDPTLLELKCIFPCIDSKTTEINKCSLFY